MKSLVLILVAFLLTSWSPRKASTPVVVLDKSTKNSGLQLNESLFKFTFKSLTDLNPNRAIRYSIDGVEGEIELANNEFVEFKTTPGEHVFQFYYNRDYYEVQTDTLLIRPGYKDDYSIYFQDAIEQKTVRKPVIYFYPETEINVEVRLDIKGKATLMYPDYNEGWKFTAQPNGTLMFGDKSYNYLFWEADQAIELTPEEIETGFVFEGANAGDFLEEKLTIAGLSSKEKADFITFWAPQMLNYEGIYIHFDFNKTCNKYAELSITPTPTTLYRIYILWSPIDPDYKVKEQEIIPMTRKGFTVIEWGGQEHEIGELIEKNNEL